MINLKKDLTLEQLEYVERLFKRIHKMTKEEQIQAANNVIEITGAPRHFVQHQIIKQIEMRSLEQRVSWVIKWLRFPFAMTRAWLRPYLFKHVMELLRKAALEDEQCACLECLIKAKKKESEHVHAGTANS